MLSLVIFLAACPLFQQSPSLIGVWEGTDPYGVKAVLELKRDGSAHLQIGEENLFASENQTDSPKLIFSLDNSKSPAHFDLIVLDTSGEEIRKARLLVRWDGSDRISLAMGPELKNRPKGFDSQDRVHTLQLRRK